VRLKLDENLGCRCVDILSEAGHDVSTVFVQELNSAKDIELISACRREDRALVTLDLDFSNPLVFPPGEYSGIAVLRLGSKPSHEDLIAVMRTLTEALRHEPLEGKLWSVEIGRVRVYQPTDDPTEDGP
jgi:predicted nuclease of predicted toxin-antitoxin system